MVNTFCQMHIWTSNSQRIKVTVVGYMMGINDCSGRYCDIITAVSMHSPNLEQSTPDKPYCLNDIAWDIKSSFIYLGI